MNYVRICKHLNDKGRLVKEHQISDIIDDPTIDWYTSHYYYNEDQFNQFRQSNTIAGITDVKTNKLLFDFDADLKVAKSDTELLVQRLQDLDITTDAIQIAFSGRKGFTVIVETDNSFTPSELKQICYNVIGEGLSSLDSTVYNASRVIRVPCTRHQVSGLYKLPLSVDRFISSSTEDILRLAGDFNNCPQSLEYNVFQFSDQLKNKLLTQNIKPTKKLEIEGIDSLSMNNKPKYLSNCKWALQNGFFKEGLRSHVFTALASTYKAQGFDRELVYRMLKGVAVLQAKKNNCERFSDEELYNNIIVQVFSPHWQGGIYTCKKEGWLKDYCVTLGNLKCKHEDKDSPKTLLDITGSFKDYVSNIEKNTIITGLPTLDKNVFISTGANVGIIGSAGSGKSSICLNILNNTSKLGVKSVFASLDMHHNRMFEKVMYKITGLKRGQLYDIFKRGEEKPYIEQLKKEFGNVNFFHKSCPSVADIKEYILRCQEESGEKIKLVMLDYFERVSSDFSDDTQASKRVAGELQDLVNDLDIALITLVQPNKMALSGGIDAPIYDYTKIKGSSYVYQSFRIILSLWRPFYNPKDFSNDRYMQMATLKNDLGELGEFAFAWDGARGQISELSEEQYNDLEQLLDEKKKAQDESDW